MRYRMFFVPVFVVVCSLSFARAGEFVSPQGFTLTYPENWKIASKEQLVKIAETTKKITGADPGFILFLFGPPSEDFAPNVNVIPSTDHFALDSATENKILKGFKDRFAALGSPATEIKTAHIRVDGQLALSLAYQQKDPAAKKQLRTWTIIFPTKNGSCIMTCGALKSQWAEAGPVFKSIINSLKIEGAPAK